VNPFFILPNPLTICLTIHLHHQAERDEARQLLDRKERDTAELKEEHRATIEDTKVLLIWLPLSVFTQV